MRTFSLLFSFFILGNVQAQYDQLPVFHNLNGEGLLDSLEQRYKPINILGYDEARDTLYANIYTFDDSVRCVYTGHAIEMIPNVDPSTLLHRGGVGTGINAEHTYPQSKGADEGNARSDMHHIFPARAAANSARNNFPFAEIEDERVNAWYYKDLTESSPTHTISYYSELDILASEFEPREDHKGNAARAVFYFYTMYKQQADAADPTFFAKQLVNLCQWHMDDPVDSLEWERNYLIAAYQEGKVNPFILDCSLPFRTYCPYLPHNSCYTETKTLADLGVELYYNYPNPANHSTIIAYELDEPTRVSLIVYNALGQKVIENNYGIENVGLQQHVLDCSTWSTGLYSYQLIIEKEKQRLQISKQFVVSR